MKRFSAMTNQEVLDETVKIKTKLDDLQNNGGFMSGIRLQWGLAKYQNMAEECLRRGISPNT